MPNLVRPILDEAVRRLGPAEIYVGDPMVVDGMELLGTLEGERRAEIEYSDNKLIMPEHSGQVPHDITSAVSAARVIGTIVLNTEGSVDIWRRINPLGSNAGGASSHIRKPTFGVVLIPHRELGKDLTYNLLDDQWERTEDDDTVVEGADAAPIHSVWLWKAHVMHGSIPYGFEDGGKSRVDVTLEGMYDVSKPDGARVFLIGNPYAFETPIEVFSALS
jgi:hypothetical protein